MLATFWAWLQHHTPMQCRLRSTEGVHITFFIPGLTCRQQALAAATHQCTLRSVPHLPVGTRH